MDPLGIRNWGYYDLPAKGNLGLQLMSVMPERNVKPSMSNGAFLHHRDCGIPEFRHRDCSMPEPSIPMDFGRDGWIYPNRENKMLHVLPMSHHHSNFRFLLPEPPIVDTIQMMQIPDHPEDEMSPQSSLDEPKKRPQGGPEKLPKAKKPKKVAAPKDEATWSPTKAGKKNVGLVINGIDLDIPKIATPVCSCIGTPQQCYRDRPQASYEPVKVGEVIYNVSVDNIFEVEPSACPSLDDMKKLPNKFLLWCGSRSSNMLRHLHKGFQPAICSLPVHGYMFGRVIVCSDAAAEAARYAFTAVDRPEGFLVLAVASLGDQIIEITKSPEDTKSLEEKNMGVKGLGRKKNDESEHFSWRDDVKVPCGRLVPSGCDDSPLEYNEYAVYEPQQVRHLQLLMLPEDRLHLYYKKGRVDDYANKHRRLREFARIHDDGGIVGIQLYGGFSLRQLGVTAAHSELDQFVAFIMKTAAAAHSKLALFVVFIIMKTDIQTRMALELTVRL